MNPERFQAARAHFEHLLDLPLQERVQQLATLSAADPEMGALLKSFFAEEEATGPALSGLIQATSQAVMARTLLQTGQSLGGYTVERRLGTGGMAEVWCVHHDGTGQQYALKLLTTTTPALQQRLLKEGRAQAALNHSNILPVLDVLDVHGQPALLMPLIEGGSLDKLLARQRLSEAEALALFQAVTAGLAAAHAGGFAHRDLKPANILLTVHMGALCPKIADFGLVKIDSGERTRTGMIFGTPAYAAPEQLLDAARSDRRADLFSLGIILVELLTGARPFAGGSLHALREAHRHPPMLSDMPAAWRPLARALLSLDPAARPDCAGVMEALSGVSAAPLSSSLLPSSPLVFEASPRCAQSLPLPPRPLIGRDAERAAVAALLQTTRLVTLVGPGGVGKSHLALTLAHQGAWPGGAWWIDLSEAHDRGAILQQASQALSVAPSALMPELRARDRALLILDNAEHLIEECAEVITDWLDQTTSTVLTTSRRPTRLRGEEVVPLARLSDDDAACLLAACGCPDVRADPTLPTLLEALDGLPLAIVLAASQGLRPSRLHHRLPQLLDFSAPGTAHPTHHRTLRASIQRSWSRLGEHEREVLVACSTFTGAFTLNEAAASVHLSDPTMWVEDVLLGLVEEGLLWLVTQHPEPELQTIKPVRTFISGQH